MNFRNVLMENHSVALMKSIKSKVGNDQKLFGELMKLSLSNDQTIAPRASWAALHCGDKNQELLNPWIGKMTRHLSNETHSSVKRNLLRLLQEITIPEKFRGSLIEISYKLVFSSKEPVAVKVFALTVIANQVKFHPELKSELEIVLKELMHPEAPPSILARGKMLLKKLARIKISN